jgi:hypothetical protein
LNVVGCSEFVSSCDGRYCQKTILEEDR